MPSHSQLISSAGSPSYLTIDIPSSATPRHPMCSRVSLAVLVGLCCTSLFVASVKGYSTLQLKALPATRTRLLATAAGALLAGGTMDPLSEAFAAAQVAPALETELAIVNAMNPLPNAVGELGKVSEAAALSAPSVLLPAEQSAAAPSNSASQPITTAVQTLMSSPAAYGLAGIGLALIALVGALSQPQPKSQKVKLTVPRRPVPGVNTPFNGGYDPETARQYFAARPLLVLRRFLEGLWLTNGLIIGIILDQKLGREGNEAKRAKTTREVAVKLGPTFIKLGQALSIRPDLIPEAYSSELRLLQDAVPPFDSATARTIISQELGVTEEMLTTIFIDMSPEPVASASIGQVYKATLKDGRQVAVKVQRPEVGGIIALDLHIVRTIAPIYKKWTKTETDLVALVDEWGKGFVDELDYGREAENTTNFRLAMAKRGLDAVTSPEVIYSLSSARVLTTQWVNGCRLDQSQEKDVPRLCGVALNAYLSMLLDTGVLHCDPHPGNLLRMDDGRLCILDWGMTTAVKPNLQYALLDYITHIISEDYEKLPTDFVNLGFLVPEKEDEIRRSGTLAPLTYMLQQLAAGGGPKKVRERIFQEYREKYPGKTDDELRVEMRSEMKARIEEERKKQGVDVGSITYKVEELQATNRAAFRVPPYFLYISRAFATLEGIGLQMDENYAILKECYPYLARRLLSDTSPRAEAALRSLLYGTSNRLNPKNLNRIANGFSQFTRSTSSATGTSDQTVLWQGAEILFAPQGNVLQQVLVDEAAAATSAFAKDLLANTLRPTKQLSEALGPLAAPLLLPVQALAPLSQKTAAEDQSQALFTSLLNQESAPRPEQLQTALSQIDGTSVTKLLDTEILNRLQKLQPGVSALGTRFTLSLLKQLGSNVEQVVVTPDPSVPPVAKDIAQSLLTNVKATQEVLDAALPSPRPPNSQ